jgi:hypothetical protein
MAVVIPRASSKFVASTRLTAAAENRFRFSRA